MNKIPLKERPVLKLKLAPAPITPAKVAPPAGEASEARRERALRIRDTLIERWPNCFKGPEQAKLPLKIGIHRDIKAIAPELSTKDLGTAIRSYVSDDQYRQAMVAGAARFDLDGNPAGVVAPDESYAGKPW
jgi:sRNA-binding protein